jgi:flagellar biosynthesis protein FliR
MLSYAIVHEELYFLVLLRMVAFIGASPLMSLRGWPVWAKLGLGLFVSMLVVPNIHTAVPSPFNDPGKYILDALLETFVGLLLGFTATAVFSILTIAGQMVDIQIGFSSAQLFDPGTSEMAGLSGTFNNILFTLYFLGINGLDGMLLTIMNSYNFIPVGDFHLPSGTWQVLTHLLGLIMSIAVQLAAPLLVALLLTDITFALLSRAVPQMNVYVVGLPAKLLVGLTLYMISMPGIIYLFNQIFTLMFEQMNSLQKFIGG